MPPSSSSANSKPRRRARVRARRPLLRHPARALPNRRARPAAARQIPVPRRELNRYRVSVLRRTTLRDGWQLACPGWLVPPARFGYSTLEWLDASVPGSVHTDLMAAGIIPDPFARRFELGCQWVDAERWVYKTHF